MGEIVKKYLGAIDGFVDEPGVINDTLTFIQNKTQVKKVYIAYGVLGFMVLWLAFGWGAQLLCNAIGFLYPAYCSIKALESSDKKDDTQWLMYWVVFALFSNLEFFSDILVGWVPFYWLSKCAFLIWCMSPMDGATIIYKKIVLPIFLKHQNKIDAIVSKGKNQVGKLADAAIETAKDMAAEHQLNKKDE